MPGPSPEPDVLDCVNSCESREDPNILCSVSLMVTPSTPLPALAWNRRYTDWSNKPSERGNPVNEFYKKGCQEEKLRLDRRREDFLSRDPAHCCKCAPDSIERLCSGLFAIPVGFICRW